MRRRDLLIAAPAVVLASALHGRSQAHDPTLWAGDRIRGELIARFRPGVDPSEASAILRRHRGRLARHFETAVPRAWHIRCPAAEEQSLGEELEASGLVEYAHHVVPVEQSAVPNDPGYSDGSANVPWAIINAPTAWDRFKLANFASMPPCVDFDTGVQGTFSGGVFTPTHVDLNSTAVVLPGRNAIASTADVTDSNGHGTSVAGIMAAITNNSAQVVSVGWGGTVLPVLCTTGSSADIINGMNWVANPVNVTPPGFTNHPYNFGSWAGQGYNDAVTALWNAGFINFGSTGDLGSSTCRFGPCDVPAPYMVGVTAVDGAGSTPLNRGGVTTSNTYANYGPAAQAGGCGTTACAPGGDGFTHNIQTLKRNATWQGNVYGTSFSAPIVCGIARFLKTIQPGLTQQHIYNLITDQSLAQATTGFTGATQGSKCIDMSALLVAALATAPVALR